MQNRVAGLAVCFLISCAGAESVPIDTPSRTAGEDAVVRVMERHDAGPPMERHDVGSTMSSEPMNPIADGPPPTTRDASTETLLPTTTAGDAAAPDGPMSAGVGGGWTGSHVGTPTLPGSFKVEGATLSMVGAGNAFCKGSFYFVHRAVTGDVELTARLVRSCLSKSGARGSTDPRWLDEPTGGLPRAAEPAPAKPPLVAGQCESENAAGISFREGLAREVREIFVGWETVRGATGRHRSDPAEHLSFATRGGENVVAPVWLRLSRRAGLTTAQYSRDRQTWTTVLKRTSEQLPFGATLHIGFYLGAESDTTTCTATFDEVQIVR